MGSTLYVGNLPFSTTEDEIRSLFEANGRSVSEIRLINDRESGRPRGFGFVEMASEEDAQKALEALASAELSGRRLTITVARER